MTKPTMERRTRKLVLGLALVLACLVTAAAQQSARSQGLVGTTWQWDFYADSHRATRLLTPNQTVTFNADGSFNARADCNSVRGEYNAGSTAILILPGPSTLVACAPGSAGGDFIRLLGAVMSYSFSPSGDLILDVPEVGGSLTLRALRELTGTINYLPRIALPADATVTVTLQDVSLADAPAVVIGEQVFVTRGAQVPLPFTISYAVNAIEPSGLYSVRARINDAEGRLLFVTDTLVPVLSRGNALDGVEVMVVQP